MQIKEHRKLQVSDLLKFDLSKLRLKKFNAYSYIQNYLKIFLFFRFAYLNSVFFSAVFCFGRIFA